MKHFIYIAFLFFTALSFGQNTGAVVGEILDSELNNAPLVLANVSVKGTAIDLNTDLSGFFSIENLEAGDHVLICSFVGYETQEVKVRVDALQPIEIKVSLAASSISLDDLELLTSVIENVEVSLAVTK